MEGALGALGADPDPLPFGAAFMVGGFGCFFAVSALMSALPIPTLPFAPWVPFSLLPFPLLAFTAGVGSTCTVTSTNSSFGSCGGSWSGIPEPFGANPAASTLEPCATPFSDSVVSNASALTFDPGVSNLSALTSDPDPSTSSGGSPSWWASATSSRSRSWMPSGR